MKTVIAIVACLLFANSAQAQTNIFGNPWDLPTTTLRPIYTPPPPVYTPSPPVSCITIPLNGGATTTSCR